MSVLPLPHAGPYASGQPHHWRHQPGQLCILGRLCWLERRSGHKSCTVTADNTQLENLWFTKSSFLWHHDPCQINLKLMIELPQLIKVNLEVVFNKTKIMQVVQPKSAEHSYLSSWLLEVWTKRLYIFLLDLKFWLSFLFRIRLEPPLQMGADSYRAENGQERPHTANQVCLQQRRYSSFCVFFTSEILNKVKLHSHWS